MNLCKLPSSRQLQMLYMARRLYNCAAVVSEHARHFRKHHDKVIGSHAQAYMGM